MQTKNYLFSLPISHVHYYENFRQTVQGLQFAASRHRLSVRKGLTDPDKPGGGGGGGGGGDGVNC